MSVYTHDPVLVQRALNKAEARSKEYKDIDDRGFSWYVWAVCATGLFADAYSYSSMDTAFPAIAYVFWNSDIHSNTRQSILNYSMLTGFLLGQVFFGHLSDRFGRLKLYGYSLIATIFGTIYLTQSSTGVNGSLSIMPLLGSWRFVTGFGTGGNFALSPIIAAECSPALSRARMLAAVFLMRSLGQLATAVMAVVALAIVNRNMLPVTEIGNKHAARTIDMMWRIIIGAGMLPTFFAYVLSLTKSETSRYQLDAAETRLRVIQGPILPEAVTRNTSFDLQENVFPSFSSIGVAVINDVDRVAPPVQTSNISNQHNSLSINVCPTTLPSPRRNTWIEELPNAFSREGMKQYFWAESNWKRLAGVSICWFAIEFTACGLRIDDSSTISQLWGTQSTGSSYGSWLEWSQQDVPNISIYHVIQHDATLASISTCLGAVAGSLAFIVLVDYFPRKTVVGWSFLSLAILFVIPGGLLLSHAQANDGTARKALFVICQVIFNAGLLPFIFMTPTEIFPTRYRGTCYAISAAFGTLGRIVSSCFMVEIGLASQDASKIGLKLVVLCIFMLVCAIVMWKWIPEMQQSRDAAQCLRLPSKNLEALEGDFVEGSKVDL